MNGLAPPDSYHALLWMSSLAMSRVMNGQAVDIDFGKHETSSYSVCEFWVSVLARLGAAVRSVGFHRSHLRADFAGFEVRLERRKPPTVSCIGVSRRRRLATSVSYCGRCDRSSLSGRACLLRSRSPRSLQQPAFVTKDGYSLVRNAVGVTDSGVVVLSHERLRPT